MGHFQYLSTHGLTPEQLQRSKQAALGAVKLANMSNMHRVYQFAQQFNLFGSVENFTSLANDIERVDNLQICEVMQKIIESDRATTVFVKGADGAY